MYAHIVENTEHKIKGCVAEQLLSWINSLYQLMERYICWPP